MQQSTRAPIHSPFAWKNVMSLTDLHLSSSWLTHPVYRNHPGSHLLCKLYLNQAGHRCLSQWNIALTISHLSSSAIDLIIKRRIIFDDARISFAFAFLVFWNPDNWVFWAVQPPSALSFQTWSLPSQPLFRVGIVRCDILPLGIQTGLLSGPRIPNRAEEIKSVLVYLRILRLAKYTPVPLWFVCGISVPVHDLCSPWLAGITQDTLYFSAPGKVESHLVLFRPSSSIPLGLFKTDWKSQ